MEPALGGDCCRQSRSVVWLFRSVQVKRKTKAQSGCRKAVQFWELIAMKQSALVFWSKTDALPVAFLLNKHLSTSCFPSKTHVKVVVEVEVVVVLVVLVVVSTVVVGCELLLAAGAGGGGTAMIEKV